MPLVSLQLSSSRMKFAAAHFTLFSATERENIHGHNFTLTADLTAPLQPDGLVFDYTPLKNKLAEFCDALDEKLLLPLHSPYLNLDLAATPHIAVNFNTEVLYFLPRDVCLLPIANSSVENLAVYFLEKLLATKDQALFDTIEQLTLTVASSPAQHGRAYWQRGNLTP